MGMTAREIGAVLTACILMVLAASTSIWHYVGVEKLKRTTFLDEYNIHVIKTLLPVGTVVGTVIFSLSAELIGRKITLLAISVPYVIAFTLFQLGKSMVVICIAQVIAGLSVGGTLVVVPIYIGEISVPCYRGILGALMAVFFHTGLILYRILGAYTTYNVVNISSIFLAILFFILFFIIGSESPFYYIKKHKSSHAQELKETRLSDRYNEEELRYIQETKIMRCFGRTGWIKSVTIMIILINIYHLSGVYMVPMLIHYTFKYFEFKYNNNNLEYNTILITSYAFQLLGSIICACLVDKIGRKLCLMISTLGIGIILAPIAIHAAVRRNYVDIDPVPSLNIIFVVAFLIFFNIGIYPVFQILLGELFPLQFKTVAVAILVSIQQVTVFTMKTYYSEITWMMGSTLSLFLFMGSMFAATGLLYFVMLETKQKSLQEIQLALKNK